MKIDKVYVCCCKKDLYLTKICIASIRYWNQNIPISLIKDLSLGSFSTEKLEYLFNISVAPMDVKKTGPYSKLYPFIEEKKQRVMLIDSDIILLNDIITTLEKFDEDVIVDGYSPENPKLEISKWYLNENNLKKYYSEYHYPGFLFNSGQIVLSNSKFSKNDFLSFVNWEENVKPFYENIFLCEDQGILNYVIAHKIFQNQISVRSHKLFIWGWSDEAKKISVQDIIVKKPFPFMVHWYGKKNGLINFLPNSQLLKFYEAYYYSKFHCGSIKLQLNRLRRTIMHIDVFIYEVLKSVYLNIRRLLTF